MTYPETERLQELVECGLEATMEVLPDSSGVDGLCRPGEVLADDAGLSRLQEILGESNISVVAPVGTSWRNTGDFLGGSLESLNQRLHGATGLRLVSVRDSGPIGAFVDAMRAEIGDGEGRVHPNRVMTGEPVYMGGPAEEPEPDLDVGIQSHTDRTDRPSADIGVLDTGINSNHPWQADVILADPNDLDTLTRPDGRLATEAGHGLFICGIVTRVAEGTLRIDPGRVLNQYGYADDAMVSPELHEVMAPVINLSWGCFADRFGPPAALAEVIRKMVDEGRAVVAAAGNKAIDRRFYPAAFDGVFAVGALDTTVAPRERAFFSNLGDWVTVWAPGRRLRSAYVDGSYVINNEDREFHGAARWSGTSFAAPVVAAAIAQLYKNRDTAALTPKDVADAFIARLPSEMVPGAGALPVKVYLPAIDLTA
jgi:subtilisin family serine protease